MLTVQNLRKEFTNVVAVDGVSFTVRPGEIFGLIGPNGAGKSTTIRMIMNILKPDRGTITIDGRPQDEQTRNIIGYLPEERGLYRKNKLIHVIEYFGALRGMSAHEARNAAEPWMERFGLAQHKKRSIEELSKGNQQKVQFIISILHRPKLIVLDELFSGLDPVNQKIMREILQDLKSANTALILSTHQMANAERLCDELMMIHKGNTVLEGSPASIKRKFGKNNVDIDFTGGNSVFNSLVGVKKADLSQNHAELELADDVAPNAILEQLLPHVEVTSFARVEPSLQSIFLDIVGEGEVQSDEQPKPKAQKAQLDGMNKKVKLSLLLFIVTLLAAVFFIAREFSADAPDMSMVIIFSSAVVVMFSRYLKERKKAAVEQHTIQQEEEVQA